MQNTFSNSTDPMGYLYQILSYSYFSSNFGTHLYVTFVYLETAFFCGFSLSLLKLG